MASKRGALQRRQKSGKGGQKKPARASVQSVSISRRKRKPTQAELAALARERFLRSQRSREAWRKRKAILAEETKIGVVRKEFEEEKSAERREELEILDERIAFQNQLVEKLKKKGSLFRTYEDERRRLLDLQSERDSVAGRKNILRKAKEEREIRDQVVRQIAPTRDLLEDRVKKHYQTELETGKIVPLSKRHQTGKIWTVDNEQRSGFVIDRKVGTVVNEQNLEEIVHRMMKDAEKVKRRIPSGKIYASFSLFEYGRDVPKSSQLLGTDDIGSFYQSFDATSEAIDTATFEAKIRAVFDKRLRTASGKNAVLLISDQVKTFEMKSPEQQKDFRRVRRLRRLLKKTFFSTKNEQ